ncbi:hypothetical protein ACLBXP_24890, partial [Methylobacterium sp. A54F]
LNYILVGRRVWHLALTPEGDRLLTTNGVSGDVTVIDVASQRAVKSIKVGRFPWGAAVRPDGKAGDGKPADAKPADDTSADAKPADPKSAGAER